MSFRTVEVELENGRVAARGAETLPAKAHGLLTILDSPALNGTPPLHSNAAGLKRLLGSPDFKLTSEQLRASMEADLWKQ